MSGGKRRGKAVRVGYHHGDLRRALVEAGLAIVREKDVASVSLREAARRAGVSPAAPYHHFPDKSFLLAAVAEEGFRLLTARMRQAVDRPPRAAGTERLERLGQAYVRFATGEPAHYRVMYSPEFIGGRAEEQVQPAALEALSVLTSELQALLPAAQHQEILVLAITLWSTCHGLALLLSEGVLRRKAHLPLPPEERLVRAVVSRAANLLQLGQRGSTERRRR